MSDIIESNTRAATSPLCVRYRLPCADEFGGCLRPRLRGDDRMLFRLFCGAINWAVAFELDPSLEVLQREMERISNEIAALDALQNELHEENSKS